MEDGLLFSLCSHFVRDSFGFSIYVKALNKVKDR